MYTIDWTHAHAGQHAGVPSSSSGLESRLSRELDAGTLPFLDFSYLSDLEREIPRIRENLPQTNHVVLLGIGGSALGARALQKAFSPGQDRPGHNGPWLWIADNIDAPALESWMRDLRQEDTLLIVVSKSGGTIETMAQYFLLRAWLKKGLGSEWTRHVVIITDPVSGPLRQEASDNTITTLPVPSTMGGRYSVLSAVGLFPAACLGMDWQALAHGARDALAPLVNAPASIGSHPAFKMASWAEECMRQGYSQLIFFSYIPAWNYLGQWFAQLWAESLGKEGKGSMPLPAVGVTDQHSLQQMFLDGPRDKACLFITAQDIPAGPAFDNDLPEKWAWLRGRRFGDLLAAEALSTRMALAQREVPLVHLNMGATDEYACGRLMGLCMAATLFTGWLLDINPLDQPAVELGKRLANARLGAPGYQEENAALENFLSLGTENSLQEF